MKVLLGCLAVCHLLTGVPAIQMRKVHFPSHVIRGQRMNLTCDYNPEGAIIYKVKWYKDHQEFFSFAPGTPDRTFHVLGVHVNRRLSDASSVVVDNVERSTEGNYTCEVTVDVTFDTVMNESYVKVVDLPRGDPVITKLNRTSMEVGDSVHINCTSHKSRPAATLAWFVNGARLDDSSLTRYLETVDRDDLRTVTLGLDFRLRESHFSLSGQVTLKCTATIESVYFRSRKVEITSMTLAQRMVPGSGCLGSPTVALLMTSACALLLGARLPAD